MNESTAEENLAKYKEFCAFVKSLSDEEIKGFSLFLEIEDVFNDSKEEIEKTLYKIKNRVI